MAHGFVHAGNAAKKTGKHHADGQKPKGHSAGGGTSQGGEAQKNNMQHK